MNFVSTRGGAPAVGFSTAVAAGLAPDGGLYVPGTLPQFDAVAFRGGSSLHAIGTQLLAPFLEGDPLAGALADICIEAFNFSTPLVTIGADETWVLELFHGPTAAFKDVGAQFLAACIRRMRVDAVHPLTVLVATSGDTGAAVAAAFCGAPGINVVILHPQGRVSARQQHQLGCFGNNVTSLAVAGSFDECQALVKQALGDQSLQLRMELTSANSISLGRLLPQMVYYAQASLAHYRQHAQPLNFIIPTGNLGNAMAAALARAVGLPIGRLALASNANAVLAEYFAGARYRPRPSIATLANAMDVAAPSNFERLRWLYPDERELRAAFDVRAIQDQQIRAAIGSAHARYGVAFCPHTATALHLLDQFREQGDRRPWAVVATAHPAKFENIVEALVGAPVAVPPALAELLARPAASEAIAVDYPSLRQRLLRMACA